MSSQSRIPSAGATHKSSVSSEQVQDLKRKYEDAIDEQRQIRKEFQEFREVIEERDKLKDRFWKERVAYISIIVALLVGLATVVV